MLRRHGLFALALILFAGALARDEVDAWVDCTALPSTVIETSAERWPLAHGTSSRASRSTLP
jgi:hypothetical protein